MIQIKYYLFSIVLFLFSFNAFSQQEVKRFQLVNQIDNQPLSFTHFNYGKQKGLSDEKGFVELRFEKGTKLEISHVSTGYQIFDEETLLKASETKKLTVPGGSGYNLQPVTVIALRPAAVEKETMNVGLQEQLAHDAGAYLQMNPVISGIRKSGSSSVDPVMRGFKYEQLTIVTDGACGATAACPNRMDPPSSQVSLNMMEKVEILKGPHALRYGNSFGGTIHFLSPASQYSDKIKPLARVSAGYESNGSIFRTEAMAGLRAKNIQWQLFGALSQGSDYTDGNGDKVAANFYRNSLGTTLSVKLGQKQEVRLSAQHNYAKDVDFPSLPMDLRSDDAWLLNARHSVTFKDKPLQNITTIAYATFVDHFMDNRLKELNPRMMNAETPAKTSNLGGRSEALIVNGTTKMYIGADGRSEEAEGSREREFLMGPLAGKTFYDNAWQHGQITKISVFAEYQKRINDWAIVASLRAEANQSKVKDPTKDFLEVYPDPKTQQFNPSVSAGITHYWNSHISTALWLGRTQRSGSLSERYINFFPVGLDAYEMLGNPDLKPEVNNQADLNFQYQHEKTAFSLNFFAAYLQNFISGRIDTTLTPRISSSPGVRRYVNLDRALMTGFEVNFSQSLPAHLQADVNIAYVFGKDLSDDKPLPEIPPLDMRIALSGNYFKHKFKPELSFRYVLEQDRINESFGENSTPEFVLIDISMEYKINKAFRVKTGVKNLLDEAYYEHLSRAINGKPDQPLYAPGRNIFLTLNYSIF